MSNEQNESKKERRPFAPGLCFNKLVWVFLISCVVGFLVETLWCYMRHGYIESRQSLVYGPLSVAYGMGAVVLTMALYKFRNSLWWKIFLVSFVVGTVTEYICSLGQELVFGSVAWDYSNVPLNINGRVCLLYSVFWGILGIAWIKLIYPPMAKLIGKLPIKLGKVLTWHLSSFLFLTPFCPPPPHCVWTKETRAQRLVMPLNPIWTNTLTMRACTRSMQTPSVPTRKNKKTSSRSAQRSHCLLQTVAS